MLVYNNKNTEYVPQVSIVIIWEYTLSSYESIPASFASFLHSRVFFLVKNLVLVSVPPCRVNENSSIKYMKVGYDKGGGVHLFTTVCISLKDRSKQSAELNTESILTSVRQI